MIRPTTALRKKRWAINYAKYLHCKKANKDQTRPHSCHWPGCTKEVPQAMWGCREHWYRLPQYLRTLIWQAYVPGQEITMTPSAKYLEVMRDAQEWIARQSTGNTGVDQ